ncbi:MAG: enoyl-CoA hydratase/isomerase family protein, partial [Propionibacteriaceae bacterium]|nr:enoyl-CoA hydratase/isomerase family protein [Propionibacteriaceae bacterium]
MSFVRYEAADHVATCTIERESSLNALNSEVLHDLKAALGQAEADDVRVLVVTGAGTKAFVAGADVAQMAQMTRREAQAFSQLGNAVFRQLERLPFPTIAAVNGFALGGGCELALSCDIRLASNRAVFGQPEVSLGITPGFGGTQRLARVIGLGLAKELLFSARKIDAARALAIGLVSAVVEPDQLAETTAQLAREIARQAPIAVRSTKLALALGLQTDIDSALALEAACFAACFETAD